MTLAEIVRLIAALSFAGGSVYFLYSLFHMIGDDAPRPPHDR